MTASERTRAEVKAREWAAFHARHALVTATDAYLAGAAAEREAVLAVVRGHIARCAEEQAQPEELQGDCYHEGRACEEVILQELEALK